MLVGNKLNLFLCSISRINVADPDPVELRFFRKWIQVQSESRKTNLTNKEKMLVISN
jgi:hypothetical protein